MIRIATPTAGSIRRETVECLMALDNGGIHTTFSTSDVVLIDHARTTLVQEAMQAGASHLFFVDSDMVFPPDTLYRLLNYYAPIVAANYRKRRPPHDWTASISSDGRTGHEAVTHIGLGCALIDLDVFHSIPLPWFNRQHPFLKEDLDFCEHCVGAGYTLYIDHGLSQQVKHLTTVAV